jgi:hypothetical protein
VRVDSLHEKQVDLQIPVFEDVLNIRYRPMGIPSSDTIEQEGKTASFAFIVALLPRIVTWWDLEERDGSMVELSEERLRLLPSDLVSTVLAHIVHDKDMARVRENREMFRATEEAVVTAMEGGTDGEREDIDAA